MKTLSAITFFVIAISSCTSIGSSESVPVDTIYTDSIIKVDSIAMDTLMVDTVCVDTAK